MCKDPNSPVSTPQIASLRGVENAPIKDKTSPTGHNKSEMAISSWNAALTPNCAVSSIPPITPATPQAEQVKPIAPSLFGCIFGVVAWGGEDSYGLMLISASWIWGISVITATFTGPRRTPMFPKAARPAAPCATYCYHAVQPAVSFQFD